MTVRRLTPASLATVGDDGAISIFQYRRGSGQGEGRLHAKRSVGVGGHISLIDAENDGELHPYQEGMRRELEEEVFLDGSYEERCVGLIALPPRICWA